MAAGDQPNSVSRGTMRTPGVERIAAEASNTMKVIANTTQP